MSPIIMDGKALAAKLNEQAKEKVTSMPRKPGLAIIQVGDDPASNVYVRNKLADCEKIGIKAKHIHLSAKETTTNIQNRIYWLNQDPTVDGIIVQLPLPAGLDARAILDSIAPYKDVDCLGATNTGHLVVGDEFFQPCTPAGIIHLLKEYAPALAGKTAVILGRSDIVGKPLIQLLLRENVTVTVCHSRTDPNDMMSFVDRADIVIAAMGDRTVLEKHKTHSLLFQSNKILIDVAMNRNEEGKLCGDIPKEWCENCQAYTPVPGGVGPMTRAMLMQNVIRSVDLHGKY